jgi:hypothetical protein
MGQGLDETLLDERLGGGHRDSVKVTDRRWNPCLMKRS